MINTLMAKVAALQCKLFPRVYSGTEKLRHSKKIGWLKSNVSQLDPEDQQQAKKVLFHHRLSIYLIVALFIVFYGGLILGVNK